MFMENNSKKILKIEHIFHLIKNNEQKRWKSKIFLIKNNEQKRWKSKIFLRKMYLYVTFHYNFSCILLLIRDLAVLTKSWVIP